MNKVDWVGVMYFFIFVIVFIFITFIIVTSSFGSRCSNAGYLGADHEKCVIRLNNNGPVYEENIGYDPRSKK